MKGLPLILAGLGIGALVLMAGSGEAPSDGPGAGPGGPPPAPGEWNDAAEARARAEMERVYADLVESAVPFDLGWLFKLQHAAADKIWPEWTDRPSGEWQWPSSTTTERIFYRKVEQGGPEAPPAWMETIWRNLGQLAQDITGYRPVT